MNKRAATVFAAILSGLAAMPLSAEFINDCTGGVACSAGAYITPFGTSAIHASVYAEDIEHGPIPGLTMPSYANSSATIDVFGTTDGLVRNGVLVLKVSGGSDGGGPVSRGASLSLGPYSCNVGGFYTCSLSPQEIDLLDGTKILPFTLGSPFQIHLNAFAQGIAATYFSSGGDSSANLDVDFALYEAFGDGGYALRGAPLVISDAFASGSSEAAVPEPGSLGLIACGVCGLALGRRFGGRGN